MMKKFGFPHSLAMLVLTLGVVQSPLAHVTKRSMVLNYMASVTNVDWAEGGLRRETLLSGFRGHACATIYFRQDLEAKTN